MHTGDATPAGQGKPPVDVHFELSLALHSAVARVLDEESLERARGRVDEWLR